MKRRSFLKLLIATPIVASVPISFAEEKEVVTSGLKHIGNVREVVTHNEVYNQYEASWSLFMEKDGQKYHHWVNCIYGKENELERVRKDALVKLYSNIEQDSLSDASPTPWEIIKNAA